MSTQTPDRRAEQPAPQPVSIAGWVARAIAVVILLPPRLVWEGLTFLWRAVEFAGRMIAAGLRYLRDRILVPAGKLFWYWVIRPAWIVLRDYLWGLLIVRLLWRTILTPLGALIRDFLLQPLWRYLLRPIGIGVLWLGRWIERWIIDPIVRGTAAVARALGAAVEFLARWLIGWPARQLWRWVLHPLVRLVAAAAAIGWQGAAYVVGLLVVTPCRRLYRTVLRPAGVLAARVWTVTVRQPMRWVRLKVLAPMNRWAADAIKLVFGR
ncbi:hypothetical protein JK358_06225 [Nocardia sp. 2]|uniref:Uncharacterized protein n=1 Tax=Nocardia acididurans TaxID=2802282 RepID=A0ABS1M0X4_9NOCA|nr:hypothetical protein [Nocardia acididurans]MBL1073986.1 hypothetical protein [Nocardia acididurans]